MSQTSRSRFARRHGVNSPGGPEFPDVLRLARRAQPPRTPTAFQHSAQGWSGATTLGALFKKHQPQRGWIKSWGNGDATPLGLKIISTHDPG